jgi:predicted DCC family thiol-disulfide oxidoreductase YuxK
VVAGGELIYDGGCGFCTSAARWIESRWPPGAGTLVAFDQVDEARLGELGLDEHQLASQVWWVDAEGPRGGARAVAAALKAAGGPLGLAGSIMAAPPVSWLAAPCYRLVARFRHRLPGATEVCRT